LVLAELMVTWSWQNALRNEFCQWSLTMLLVMCCCETSMVLLATIISVRILNSTDKKRVWRNSWVTPGLMWLMSCICL
jgi:hypothetical protein